MQLWRSGTSFMICKPLAGWTPTWQLTERRTIEDFAHQN